VVVVAATVVVVFTVVVKVVTVVVVVCGHSATLLTLSPVGQTMTGPSYLSGSCRGHSSILNALLPSAQVILGFFSV